MASRPMDDGGLRGQVRHVQDVRDVAEGQEVHRRRAERVPAGGLRASDVAGVVVVVYECAGELEYFSFPNNADLNAVTLIVAARFWTFSCIFYLYFCPIFIPSPYMHIPLCVACVLLCCDPRRASRS